MSEPSGSWSWDKHGHWQTGVRRIKSGAKNILPISPILFESTRNQRAKYQGIAVHGVSLLEHKTGQKRVKKNESRVGIHQNALIYSSGGARTRQRKGCACECLFHFNCRKNCKRLYTLRDNSACYYALEIFASVLILNSVTSSGAQMGNLFQYFIFIILIKNSTSHRYKIEATLNNFLQFGTF